MAGAMAEMITGAMTGILSCSGMFFLLFPDNFRQGIHFIIERFHVGVNIVDMLLQFNNFFEHFCHQKSFCFLGFCLHWCFFCHDRIGYFYFWCIYSRPKYFRQAWRNLWCIGFNLFRFGLNWFGFNWFGFGDFNTGFLSLLYGFSYVGIFFYAFVRDNATIISRYLKKIKKTVVLIKEF